MPSWQVAISLVTLLLLIPSLFAGESGQSFRQLIFGMECLLLFVCLSRGEGYTAMGS
jgi:hypothetical protein